MPYIKIQDREEINGGRFPITAGELNYKIFSYYKACGDRYEKTRILKYVSEFLGETPNYQRYNDMVGCLTLCYKEIKRRTLTEVPFLLEIIDMYDREIANYENIKIVENGDVI